MPKKDQTLPQSPKKLSEAEAAIATSCYTSKKRTLRDGSCYANAGQLGLGCTKALACWLRRWTEGPSHLWFSQAFYISASLYSSSDPPKRVAFKVHDS